MGKSKEEKLLSWLGVLLLWSRGESWVTDDSALTACIELTAYIERIIRLLSSAERNEQ